MLYIVALRLAVKCSLGFEYSGCASSFGFLYRFGRLVLVFRSSEYYYVLFLVSVFGAPSPSSGASHRSVRAGFFVLHSHLAGKERFAALRQEDNVGRVERW